MNPIKVGDNVILLVNYNWFKKGTVLEVVAVIETNYETRYKIRPLPVAHDRRVIYPLPWEVKKVMR